MRVILRGRVQMVGYRMFVEREVRRIGRIDGSVRNLPDGASVEVIAEGPRSALESLLDQLRIGPSHALVREAGVSWEQATGEFDGFRTTF